MKMIRLHQDGEPVLVNLSAIETIQERGDANAVIYFTGGAGGLDVDESFEDVVTLIEIEEHG